MDSKSPNSGDGIDWNDMFNSSAQFEDSMAFNDFTNLDSYDSPAITLQAPPKTSNPASRSQHAHMLSSASTETSSQDSGSDSSSRRKRKVTSVSPTDGQMTKTEDAMMDVTQPSAVQQYHPSQIMKHDSSMDAQFEFNSAASSPIQTRDFNTAMTLNGQVQTINPGMFQLGSRDDSPVNNNMMFNNASPNALFSTPSSDSNEAFGNAGWNTTMAQNPSWPGNFNNQFASPDAFGLTPSPVGNGGTPIMSTRAQPVGKSPLHIAPISTKSRVETQINIVMTLEQPPPGTEFLHLPLHTIAKSKLLAKEDYDKSRTLELHTMLVCTSAMNTPRLREKALQRAATQSNLDVQKRAELLREKPDDEKNNMKDVDDDDKPASGGEVRICNNCIQRERKRAGRKKLKKEEEQQHWERFETERVVVFNSNEYLPFKPHEPTGQTQRDASSAMDDNSYTPPDGALQASAAMRIACYCRHQSEKEGFRVIFTLKDQQGNVVAQQMSDSILITDDHKTHPPSFSTTMPGEVYYQTTAYAPNGLPTSFSMVDLSSQAHPFVSSRSAGNLQTLALQQQRGQYNPHSHVHQMPGYASQATSATMTPTSLSRPGSPTNAGQSGPNKKRKSSSFHKRVPSGLTMTPRVDTNQTPTSNLPSAVSFSPTSATGFQQGDQSYMTIPNSQYFGSGPPTPNESGPFFTPAQIDLARAQNAQAYFSHPSSAVPSRTNSPVLQTSRPNMAAYARLPIQTPTNSIQGRQQQQLYGGQQAPGSSGSDHENSSPPTITKITPAEGPITGGTEVSIYGYNFSNGTQVMFGDLLATTVFYGPQALLATSPPSRPGNVTVTLVPPGGISQFASPPTGRQIFTYTDTNPRMMEMALRFLSEQQTGSQVQWNQFTSQVATKYLQNNMSPAGIRGQGYDGGNMMSADPFPIEDVVLNILDQVDLSESLRIPSYDLQSDTGETLLSLACAVGMHRVAAALLARGANPDVRDMGGFTPLMHAAIHGRAKTFQLLIVRGADAAIRSLKGYAALNLVAGAKKWEFQQILQDTPRSRPSRPNLLSRVSYGSTASAKSWDISSASMYESEWDGSSVTEAHSRRPSTHMSPNIPAVPNCPTAMVAWRDCLATQIQHFQRTVSSFQLPPLPALPDYQECPMVRRLSSLVPSRCLSPVQNGTAPPPPAYDDLYPSKSDSNKGVSSAMIDAAVDRKCTAMYDDPPDPCRPSAVKCATFPSMAELLVRLGLSLEDARSVGGRRTNTWCLQMCLVIILTLALFRVALPCVSEYVRRGVSTPLLGVNIPV